MQDEKCEQSVAQDLMLNETDAQKAGISGLLSEWGDPETEKSKLDAVSAPKWMEKCLVKLEETLTMV